jgi:hypothetical protein
VALTESKIKDLTDKKFDSLFTKHKATWLALAKKAAAYAKENITSGRTPRPDDIAKVLFPMLQVHDELRKHQEDNKARAKRYIEWFVEYVIDQTQP